ncbi:MAG: type II secretion system protein [Campylobacterales bacterium]|nr:type II secretion system protein [Campylobacterales bacterium]
MHRSGFTLLEMVFTIVIAGVLSAGVFKALEALYIRSAKAKAISEMSMQSQIVLDQISTLLYNRIPNSVIGYDGLDASSCTPIYEVLGDENLSVLEWLSLDDEQLLDGKYSGFVDMDASFKPNLKALGVTTDLNVTDRNLIFAGVFDAGSEDTKACGGAYGWHGRDSNLSYGINGVTTANEIVFSDVPNEIYEKYYLSDGAYAVTRGEHIPNIANCGLSESDFRDFNNTLFLFYNFYPYNSQTYCGDGGVGDVVVLAEDVVGFRAMYENDIIRLSIDMNKSIRGSNPVHISKQKGVF